MGTTPPPPLNTLITGASILYWISESWRLGWKSKEPQENMFKSSSRKRKRYVIMSMRLAQHCTYSALKFSLLPFKEDIVGVGRYLVG